MTPCPALIERTYYGRWPKPPLSSNERREIWRRRWETLTVEQTIEPIDRMAQKVVRQQLALQR
jgi:hypothetical protein